VTPTPTPTPASSPRRSALTLYTPNTNGTPLASIQGKRRKVAYDDEDKAVDAIPDYTSHGCRRVVCRNCCSENLQKYVSIYALHITDHATLQQFYNML
jgi:hypothetical protein